MNGATYHELDVGHSQALTLLSHSTAKVVSEPRQNVKALHVGPRFEALVGHAAHATV
jgi:hypothetical protein